MKVTVLTGGVGGAKLVLGLQHCEAVSSLTAIVNTGDDFRHLGLWISPDIDTLLYTLAGRADGVKGWGKAQETWGFMEAMKELGGAGWFNLGDGDLALHILRSHRLEMGETLSQITADFAKKWRITSEILPMSNDPVATMLETNGGILPFQEYFVAQQCAPVVRAIRFRNAETAAPAPRVCEAIAAADVVLIAPSNPFLSIDPILAIPQISAALRAASAPIIAISPLVGGKAVKGPTAKLMAELGLAAPDTPPDNTAIARHYDGIIDALLHHFDDPAPTGIRAQAAETLMSSLERKIALAQTALDFAQNLQK